MIILKSKHQIEKMKAAGEIVGRALALAEEKIHPGMTTKELDRIIDEFICARGARPSFKNYRGFPASACISINEVVVHGIPGGRKLKEGDIVSIDVGAYLDGFHGDAARTFPVGAVSDTALRLIEVTKQSFFEGIAFAHEGNRLFDISSAVQKHVEANGFSVVRTFVGHGIGAALHESPDVPNFGPAGHGVRLRNGMCLAVEPMVNQGHYDVNILEDGWTTVTKDGSLSAHYENTIAITEDGPQILTLI